MSNYYLCAICKHCKALWEWANEVDCGRGHGNAKVMFDHHGKDGKRYEEPRDVCADYEERREGS